MNTDDVRKAVLEALGDVVPEADLEALDPAADLRDQLDIDSMDSLNFAIGIHKRTGVDIPERDYRRLRTIDACISYVAGKVSRS